MFVDSFGDYECSGLIVHIILLLLLYCTCRGGTDIVGISYLWGNVFFFFWYQIIIISSKCTYAFENVLCQIKNFMIHVELGGTSRKKALCILNKETHPLTVFIVFK